MKDILKSISVLILLFLTVFGVPYALIKFTEVDYHNMEYKILCIDGFEYKSYANGLILMAIDSNAYPIKCE